MFDGELNTDQHTRDAPIGRRLFARLLDLIFALILTFLAAIPVGVVFFVVVAVTGIDPSSNVVGGAGAGLCYFIAYVALEWFLLVQREGQTLGKGLLGLRVIDDRTGNPMLPGTSFARLFVLFVPFPLLVAAGSYPDSAGAQAMGGVGFAIWTVSFVMAFFKRIRRRTLHDFAARSRVVIAATRKIDLRKDLVLMVPGKVDMTKRL